MCCIRFRICFSGCWNSNNITEFNFSHWGYFNGTRTLKGVKNTDVECAGVCREDVTCVGFDYVLNPRPGKTTKCYIYTNKDDLGPKIDDYENVTYLKCGVNQSMI